MNAKELGRKTKDWFGNHPRTTRFAKAMLEGVARAAIGEVTKPPVPQIKEGEVLGAEQVEVLADMNFMQLQQLFKGKRVTFATDYDTLKAINKLNFMQIEAILDREDS